MPAALEQPDKPVELVEILDHHRLGNPSTHVPIKFTVEGEQTITYTAERES